MNDENGQTEFSYEAAEHDMQEGMDRASAAKRVQDWKLEADHWLAHQPTGAMVTADDLIEAVGVPDMGANRVNVVGAWFSSKAKLRFIRFTGRMQKSERRTRHTGLQRVWIIIDWIG
jgi:hypothetical protein